MNRAVAAAMRWIIVVFDCMMIVTVPGGAVLPHAVTRVFGIDKVIHFVVYALLCFLVCRALAATAARKLGMRLLVLALLLTVLYGAFDEVQQAYMPNRTPSVYDFIADALGALCVAAIWPKATAKWRVLMM